MPGPLYPSRAQQTLGEPSLTLGVRRPTVHTDPWRTLTNSRGCYVRVSVLDAKVSYVSAPFILNRLNLASSGVAVIVGLANPSTGQNWLESLFRIRTSGKLKSNHPSLFPVSGYNMSLIGHGYSPQIYVRKLVNLGVE